MECVNTWDTPLSPVNPDYLGVRCADAIARKIYYLFPPDVGGSRACAWVAFDGMEPCLMEFTPATVNLTTVNKNKWFPVRRLSVEETNYFLLFGHG
jgi:hypothetical protein